MTAVLTEDSLGCAAKGSLLLTIVHKTRHLHMLLLVVGFRHFTAICTAHDKDDYF